MKLVKWLDGIIATRYIPRPVTFPAVLDLPWRHLAEGQSDRRHPGGPSPSAVPLCRSKLHDFPAPPEFNNKFPINDSMVRCIILNWYLFVIDEAQELISVLFHSSSGKVLHLYDGIPHRHQVRWIDRLISQIGRRGGIPVVLLRFFVVKEKRKVFDLLFQALLLVLPCRANFIRLHTDAGDGVIFVVALKMNGQCGGSFGGVAAQVTLMGGFHAVLVPMRLEISDWMSLEAALVAIESLLETQSLPALFGGTTRKSLAIPAGGFWLLLKIIKFNKIVND